MTTIHLDYDLDGVIVQDQDKVCEWTRAHGVDPNDVPVPCDIIFEDGQVVFELVVRDETNQLVVHGSEIARTTVTVPQKTPWPFEVTS